MDRIPPPAMDRMQQPASSGYRPPQQQAQSGPVDHLAPVSTKHDGRIWSLQVVQQPIRARMCGFGDKVSGRPAGSFSSLEGWLTRRHRIGDPSPRRRASV